MSSVVDFEEQSSAVSTVELAANHGINLVGEPSYNEIGLDFRVAFAEDVKGVKWVLRIPRRKNMFSRIEKEARILNFVKSRLHVQVPDWQVCTPELIAYPMLLDSIALTFDPQTYALTWYIDQNSDAYIESLAAVLVDLHASPIDDAIKNGISFSTSQTARTKFLADLERVKKEIGLGKDLEAQLRKWLEEGTTWPEFSVLVHGDLYAGHVTANSLSQITGIIDWSEAEITDPAIDFVGHLAAFGSNSLNKLIEAYQHAGGRTWPGMVEQINSRHAASPIRYAIFALNTGSQEHLAGAKAQLGITKC